MISSSPPPERREVEQLVDRDVLLDRAEDHPRRADHLVDAEVPEQRLVLRVVDPGDRPRHVEVMLGHLADDEVVLVVAGHRGHDVAPGSRRPRRGACPRSRRGRSRSSRARRRSGRARPGSFSMSTTSWPDSMQLLGQVVADLAAADDEDVHGSGLLGRQSAPAAATCAAGDGWPAVVAGAGAAPPSRTPRCRARRAAGGGRAARRVIRSVRQIVAMPSSVYASARTGSLILATTLVTPNVSVASWARHDVAVVALGQGAGTVGALGAGPPQRVLVGAVAAHGVARGSRRQAVEGAGRDVDDRDLVAARGEVVGEGRADPAAADDDDVHAFDSSVIGSRMTITAHGAFLRT